MAVNAPIYVYLDQVLSHTWVQVSEHLLSCAHGAQFTSAVGYQDAIREIFGRDPTANDRTRAKELRDLGLLIGPLVNPDDSGAGRSNVPLGWSRVQADCEAHTRLGYVGYAIGKSLSENEHSKVADNGLSVVAAVCLLQCGVAVGGRKWITFAAIFRHISAAFPKPAGLEQVTWDRWLAHGMIATLNDPHQGPQLVDSLLTGTAITRIAIPRPTGGVLTADATALQRHITGGGTFVGTSREKASLFWAGTPGGDRPRGIYPLACYGAGALVDAAVSFEVAMLSAGHDSPFFVLSQRDPNQPTACVLEQLTEILSQDHAAKSAWELSMKSLYDGVVESLAFLASSGQASPAGGRVFYAHGADGVVQGGDQCELRIAKDKCIAKPDKSDVVHVGKHILQVTDVLDAGVEWRIVCHH